MGGLFEQLDFLRRGGATLRWHTIPRIEAERVGQHSFGVACLLYLLDPRVSANLLIHALLHDVPEHVFGDIPAPIKADAELSRLLARKEEEALAEAGFALPEISDDERRRLKLADACDTALSIIHERDLGNTRIPFHLAHERAKKLARSDREKALVGYLMEQWSGVH